MKAFSRSALLALLPFLAFPLGCSDDESTSTPEAGVDGSVSDARAASDVAADVSRSPDGGGTDAAEAGRGDGAAEATLLDVGQGSDGADGSSSAEAATDAREASTSDAGALTPLQARGQYLVDVVGVCGDCHTPQGPMGPDRTKYLAGNPDFVVLPSGERLPSRNLTNDATGLATRTDAEIKAMFMDGTRPAATGQEPLNPIMPYYVLHNMNAADADAIVAYLRTVPGVNNPLPRRSALFDVPAPATPIDMTTVPVPSDAYPDKPSALRGRYLASQAGFCIECHTKHVMAPLPIDATKLFAGGEDFSAVFATTLMIHPVSKNLTSDNTTGLGTWTVNDIVVALTQGKAKDGTGICPPMPVGPMGAFSHLSPADALDIANYIKSLPPIVNSIPDMCVFPPAPPGDGGAEGAASDGATNEAASDAAAADGGAD